jgi:hypothetical protein
MSFFYFLKDALYFNFFINMIFSKIAQFSDHYGDEKEEFNLSEEEDNF